MMKKLLCGAAFSFAFASQSFAQCFDYSNLSTEQNFVTSFSAAACAGYAAATQQANPDVYANLRDLMAPAADVFEDVTCDARRIVVGADGDAAAKFEMGFDLSMQNASMVSAGAMSSTEYKMRVDTCSLVVIHYFRQFQALNN
jgi:hypothetical protein